FLYSKAILLSNKIILFYSKAILLSNKTILFYSKTILFYSKAILLSNKTILFYSKVILLSSKAILFPENTSDFVDFLDFYVRNYLLHGEHGRFYELFHAKSLISL